MTKPRRWGELWTLYSPSSLRLRAAAPQRLKSLPEPDQARSVSLSEAWVSPIGFWVIQRRANAAARRRRDAGGKERAKDPCDPLPRTEGLKILTIYLGFSTTRPMDNSREGAT